MRSRGRDENISPRDGAGFAGCRGLLERCGLRDVDERRHEQQVLTRAVQSLEQALGWGHEQRAPRTLDQTLSRESSQHEGDGLARGAHELTKQAVSRATELDP